MPLAKAKIEILDAAAIDPSRGLPASFEVQFNPGEYTLQKGAKIAEIAIPGIDSPILQFIGGQNRKLTLELLYDTTDQGMGEDATDVRTLTKSIYQLVKIQPTTHAPPRVRFVWGEGISFKAIVESVQQKFTLFSPKGIPVRATVSVTFREFKSLDEQLAELNLQSPDHTKRHVVKRGDTLSAISQAEYGDPAHWRVLANANRGVVTNPRRLTPGVVLEIPVLADALASEEGRA